MHQVLVEAGCDIARELYLGIVVDRVVASCPRHNKRIKTFSRQYSRRPIFSDHMFLYSGLSKSRITPSLIKLAISVSRFLPTVGTQIPKAPGFSQTTPDNPAELRRYAQI